jgi:hypothetical protein
MLAASIIRVIMDALIMEAASTSETSVNFYQTTRRKNPEDSHIYARLITCVKCKPYATSKVKNRNII